MPIETCYHQLEGVPGQPGLIRYYCASTVEEGTIMWAKEKLLAVDPVQCCLSYEIVDNNVGFKSNVATLKVLPMNGDGSMIEWGFICDPVEGDSNRYQYAISFKLSDENARIKVMQIAKATYKNGKYVYEPTQITN
ncbi:hypothetical protein JHK85_009694 [Glycine max]|nr:hypothetical protein JHK85_009694 [Glycine max]KAG5065705.1 hypothetical protein JHK86_009436 [Glycine max]